jgi:hypothetical protein
MRRSLEVAVRSIPLGFRVVASTTCAIWLACQPGSSQPQPESIQAWTELEELLAEMRESVVDEAESPLEVTDGVEYMLVGLRSAIDSSLNAREQSETLHHYTAREPLVGCPNPDQDYWTAPLDPDGRYRIHGNLGDTVYLSIVLYGYVPAEEQKTKGWGSTLESFLDTTGLVTGTDGSVELFVSRERPGDAENWLPLTGHTREIMIREFHRDRSREATAQLTIERLDTPAERTRTSAEQLAAGKQMLRAAELADTRLSDEQVATWVRQVKSSAEAVFEFRKAIGMVNLAYGVFGSNEAVVVTMEHAAARQAQPNPLVNYVNIPMELEEGESLVIEGRPPESRYWVMQFCDRWMSAPGGRRTGWLNDGTVELDPDGRYRIVAGPEDPGVGNWIDTTGHRRGALLARFVSGENVPEAPSVRVVRTSDLRGGVR